MPSTARDYEDFRYESRGQVWMTAWHPPSEPAPDGKVHGSTGLCVAPDGNIVMVSADGEAWGLPGGRPEGAESWRETFDREVLEEACVAVEHATLLGFIRSVCISGHEQRLVVVRSQWLATVAVLPWKQYDDEIVSRRLVSREEALRLTLLYYEPATCLRLFREAGSVQ